MGGRLGELTDGKYFTRLSPAPVPFLRAKDYSRNLVYNSKCLLNNK